MIAYDYPLLGIFLTLLLLNLLLGWLLVVFKAVGDIFRSDDLGGLGKALWLLLVVGLPLIGVITYLVVRGDGVTQRDIERAKGIGAPPFPPPHAPVAPI
jgi:hypothetical protein